MRSGEHWEICGLDDQTNLGAFSYGKVVQIVTIDISKEWTNIETP